MKDFLALKPGAIWKHFRQEHFSFWMICMYLFFEYVRPQSIISGMDILPWSQIFILLSAAGWIFDGKKKWTRDATNLWMVLFLVVILLSSWQAYYPQISYKKLEFFYTWLIIYFLIINIVNTEKRLFIFLLIFMLASFKLSVFGARTWALRGFGFTSWGLRGPPGYFTNSGELAIQMLIFAGLSFFFFTALKPHLGKYKKYTLLSFPITAAMTVMGASSRGSQLGLVAQLLIAFWHKISIKNLLIFVVVGYIGLQLLPEEQMQRFEEMGDDTTSQQRLLYWEHGLEMMNEHPWLGVGYFNFPVYYNRYHSNDLLVQSAELPHNIFIQVGTDTGYTGLFIYCMLIWSHFKCTRAVRKIEERRGQKGSWLHAISTGLNVGFIGFLIAGQFVSVVYYPFMWINLALCVAAKTAANSAMVAEEKARKVNNDS